VGYDPNVRLLDKLVAENNGRSDYVKPKEPIEAKVSSLYSKIKNPVMTELSVSLRGLKTRDMYPRQVGDLFDGDQILLVGRYDAGDAKKLPKEGGKGRSTLVVKGTYEGRERAFEYPVTVNGVGKKAYQFVEKLWPIRRVGYLLDEIQLHGKSKEILDELVRLSRDYGIMTPYTSFLADETTRLASETHLRDGAALALRPLAKTSGGAAHRGARSRKVLREMDKLSADYGAATKPTAGSAKAPGKAGGKSDSRSAQVAWYQHLRYPKNWKALTAGESGGAPAGSVLLGDLDGDSEEAKKLLALANVRQIGNHYVLYRRGKVWLMPSAAKLDPVKDKDKIKQIKRFSEAYFELVRANTAEQNRVLASQKDGEKLLVEFRGKAYSISD